MLARNDRYEASLPGSLIRRIVIALIWADKAYDVPEFVAAVRQQHVTPYGAQKAKCSAIDGRTTRHAGYRTSLKVRRWIEEVFVWVKTVVGQRKTRFRGLEKVRAQTMLTSAAYNLTRIGTLLDWRWSTAQGTGRPRSAKRQEADQ